MCKLHYCVQAMSYAASITILTVISVERYFAILHPIRSKQLTTLFLVRAVMAVVWLVAACCGIPYLIGQDTVTVVTDGIPLTFCIESREYNKKAYLTINFIVWYAVPLVLMMVMYSRISVVLWQSSRPDGINANPEPMNKLRHTSANESARETIVRETARPNGYANETKVVNNRTITKLCRQSETYPPPSDVVLVGDMVASMYASDENLSSTAPADYEDDWPSATSRKRAAAKKAAHEKRCPIFCPRAKQAKQTYSFVSTPIDNGTPSPKNGQADHRTPRKTSYTHTHTYNTAHQAQILRAHNGSGKSNTTTNAAALLGKAPRCKQERALLARRRVIRLLIAVIITFALCVLPYQIRMLWQTWTTRSLTFGNFFLSPITLLIFYINSALNPFLYAFLSDNFRKSLKELLRCNRSRRACKRSLRSTFSLKTLNSSIH